MRKIMKAAALVGALVVATMSFMACSKEVTCEVCGQTKSGDTREYQGEEADICDDCWEGIEALLEAAEALM